MNQDINQKIAALQSRAVEYQKQVHSERNTDKIAQLQSEFAAHISSEMGEMVKNGASAKDIQIIQDILRSAFEPLPNSYAADASEDSETNAYSEEDLLDYEPQTFLLSVEYELIHSFETGKLDKDAFVEELFNREYTLFDEMLEIIDSVVCNYDEGKSIFGGEVIAPPSGEALIINPLLFMQESESLRIIADPAIYQTESQAEKIYSTLSNISEVDFRKRFNIKKLIEANIFAGYNEEDIKRIKAEIEEAAFENFKQLCAFYKTASKQCVLIINI